MDNAVGPKLSNWTGRHERPIVVRRVLVPVRDARAPALASMGDEQEKWRRALLKKLRGAAGVKARIDAGDGASLQRSQLARGTASAVADLVARCVEAGLARDGPEIAAALAAGADGGIVAMAAANARGPDGEPGARARREARTRRGARGGIIPERRRRAAARTPSERGSTTATARADPSARAASASAPPGRSTPSPRRPTPTRHPSRSPRRRSQLCCEIRSATRRRWTRCSRPSRCTPPRSSGRARSSRKVRPTPPPTRDASCACAPAASPRGWTHGCARESTRGARRTRGGRWRRWRRREGKPASGNASATPRRGRSSGRCRRGLS